MPVSTCFMCIENVEIGGVLILTVDNGQHDTARSAVSTSAASSSAAAANNTNDDNGVARQARLLREQYALYNESVSNLDEHDRELLQRRLASIQREMQQKTHRVLVDAEQELTRLCREQGVNDFESLAAFGVLDKARQNKDGRRSTRTCSVSKWHWTRRATAALV